MLILLFFTPCSDVLRYVKFESVFASQILNEKIVNDISLQDTNIYFLQNVDNIVSYSMFKTYF